MDNEIKTEEIKPEIHPYVPQHKPEPEEPSKGSALWDFIKFAAITLAITIPFRMYVAQPFVVSGESMDSTFANGQYLYVDELSYRFEKPIRGEVIIFKFPSNTSRDLIKRVVGLPGETVELKKDSVTIYNKEYPQGLVLDEPYVTHKSESYEAKKTVLADDEYYVLGDNRPVSYDSRGWGPLKAQFIIGRPFVRLLPVSSISLFPGEYTDY